MTALPYAVFHCRRCGHPVYKPHADILPIDTGLCLKCFNEDRRNE